MPFTEIVVDVDHRAASRLDLAAQGQDGVGRHQRLGRKHVAAFEVEGVDHVDDQQRNAAAPAIMPWRRRTRSFVVHG
jgi:hypothetical protein